MDDSYPVRNMLRFVTLAQCLEENIVYRSEAIFCMTFNLCKVSTFVLDSLQGHKAASSNQLLPSTMHGN